MSIETFSPLQLTTFGTWITLLDPSDVPPGMSPNLADVEFFPGGVRTRPGLVSQYPALPGTPQIDSLKTFITPNLTQRLLLLDSLGAFYKETAPGVLSLMVGNAAGANRFFKSTTHFGREYMAFSDALIGQDMPRQYDDFFFDRVSQIGPAESPSVADSSSAGSIAPGVHQCAVVFVTRQGFWTAPSPPVSWTSTGNKVNVTNIPTGPSNIVQRLLIFTAEAGANFYNVPAVYDDQRQHDHFSHRGFQRHDSFVRHEHGLSFQPDRTARATRCGGLRRAAFLVGRAREHGQLAQPHL